MNSVTWLLWFSLQVEDNLFNLSLETTGTGKRQKYPFPLHFDLPLKKYDKGDTPFLHDVTFA